ncbi:hypothetical protein CFT12S00416_08685 [Campylobacter fetus subsp. testudinum]|nr:hypothetical protein CFT12S00416_08685 [Campylobacter fetus subsp. testudinum]OCR99097.1 hypothetical protein A9K75_08440 [Campylobacter fetus subsp. testudinum]
MQEIKDAPATISVITSDEIMNKPIRDLGDIVQEVPGVSTAVAKTGATTIQMRGMASKYTLILVDGKRINVDSGFDSNGFDSTSGFIPPTSMIERVEVIRGPASIIYGSDAMGGVINIITKKHAKEATGSVGLETRLQEHHGRWGNMYGLNGNVFAPINDQLSINVRGKYYDSEQNAFYKDQIDGFNLASQNANAKKNPYTSHTPSGYINWSLGGRIDYEINPENSIYLDSDYAFQRLGSLNTSASQITAVREYHKTNNSLNHLGDYNWGKTNSYLQYALTEKIPHQNVELGADKGEKNRDAMVKHQAWIFSNQTTTDFDFKDYGSMILNFGPYLSYEELENRQTKFDKDQYTLAAFGEAEYLINEYFSTTAGVRANHVETYGTFLNPRFYVNFFPTQDLTFKFGISSGLKAPELGTRYNGFYNTNNTTDQYGNTSLDVERSTNYELSAIYETIFADLSATVFYTEFKDAISTQTYESGSSLPNGYGVCGVNGGATCSIYENVDEATSKGFEFGFNSKPLFTSVIPRGVYLDFSYGYIKTEKKSGQNEGKALNDVPKHSLSTKLSYKTPSWDTYLRWTAKIDTPTDNTHTANAGLNEYFNDVHIVDLGTNYKFKNGITVGAVVNNLLDKDFVDYVAYNNGKSYTNNYQRMIPGRNFWLTVRADF